MFVHAFPYSQRPGTKAAEMPDQLPRAEKENRVRRANDVIRRMQEAYFASQEGRVLPVLFESEHEGHSDNYCPVRTGQAYPRGTVHNIQIIRSEGDRLLGK